MNAVPYLKKLDRVLDRCGGIYLWRDIEDRLADGRMQSFAHGNSMLITEVTQFPRAKAMDWVVAVGDLADWQTIHDHALSFADKHNVGLIRAYGRRGWWPSIRDHGWRSLTTNQVYLREM